MELGATVCTPRAPRCGACPVSRWCRAYKLGIADQLPSARRKRARVKLSLAAAVLLDRQGRTLVLKPGERDSTMKEDAALFSRMWQFPAVRVSSHAERELRRYLRASLGLEGTELVELGAARHSVTYREITLAPFLLRVERLPQLPGARTLLLAALDRLPVSSATRKIADAALQELPHI
jgi:A/G-specific adenine glycosylase